jgi:hypothetical protein
MTKVNSTDIANFRSAITEYPEALEALQMIEDCEGDLEDAAMALAIRSGLQPDQTNSQWLESLARQCRGIICQEQMQQELTQGILSSALAYLSNTPVIPAILVVPVLMYVLKNGLVDFCE